MNGYVYGLLVVLVAWSVFNITQIRALDERVLVLERSK